MLKVVDENYTMYWLVIDSHNNDTIYTHRSVRDSATVSGFNMSSFKMCFPNFDKSKIITGSILMNTNFARELNKISTTKNGKYLFAAGTNCIKIFDTNMLYLTL